MPKSKGVLSDEAKREIAEITTILIQHKPLEGSINWSGPEKTPHDFFGPKLIEIFETAFKSSNMEKKEFYRSAFIEVDNIIYSKYCKLRRNLSHEVRSGIRDTLLKSFQVFLFKHDLWEIVPKHVRINTIVDEEKIKLRKANLKRFNESRKNENTRKRNLKHRK